MGPLIQILSIRQLFVFLIREHLLLLMHNATLVLAFFQVLVFSLLFLFIVVVLVVFLLRGVPLHQHLALV